MKMAGGVALQGIDVARVKVWLLWSGRMMSAFGVLICLSSVFAKLTHESNYVGQWERLGFAESKLTGVGIAQLTGIVLYLNPPTSVLGAIYMTGYLGGAMSHWIRLGEPTPMMVPLSTCLLLWGGLFLREERLQALLPLRKQNGASM